MVFPVISSQSQAGANRTSGTSKTPLGPALNPESGKIAYPGEELPEKSEKNSGGEAKR
jgi:hypothetical protein